MATGVAHLLAEPWLLATISVIVFFAAIVQVGLGMGFGLTAAPLLALLDPELVPAPTLFLGLATSTWGVLIESGGVQWREVWTGAIGRVAGVAAATAILASLAGKETFMLVFGLMIGLGVVLSAAGIRWRFTMPRMTAMSALSGMMGTITSVGAPPMAIVYQDRPPQVARPTLAAFFMIGCLISLAGLYLSGWAGLEDFLLACMMAPGMLAGLAAARLLKGRFDRRYRPILLGTSGIAAVILIFRGLS